MHVFYVFHVFPACESMKREHSHIFQIVVNETEMLHIVVSLLKSTEGFSVERFTSSKSTLILKSLQYIHFLQNIARRIHITKDEMTNSRFFKVGCKTFQILNN